LCPKISNLPVDQVLIAARTPLDLRQPYRLDEILHGCQILLICKYVPWIL
jgi:hypothetical protein